MCDAGGVFPREPVELSTSEGGGARFPVRMDADSVLFGGRRGVFQLGVESQFVPGEHSCVHQPQSRQGAEGCGASDRGEESRSALSCGGADGVSSDGGGGAAAAHRVEPSVGARQGPRHVLRGDVCAARGACAVPSVGVGRVVRGATCGVRGSEGAIGESCGAVRIREEQGGVLRSAVENGGVCVDSDPRVLRRGCCGGSIAGQSVCVSESSLVGSECV